MRKLGVSILFALSLVAVCSARVMMQDDGDPSQRGELNGHAYVDLGLPSGTLWATCNVGTDSPEGLGDYFAWGETEPKDAYHWSNYRYYDSVSVTKYTGKDGLSVLQPCDDAATTHWGEGWRTPTVNEWRELYTYTTSEWMMVDTVSGRRFTAPNGNSIFLPASGDFCGFVLVRAGELGLYWASSLVVFDPSYAYNFSFYVEGYGISRYYRRFLGRAVRPVCSPKKE